jgi:hypothetical protein
MVWMETLMGMVILIRILLLLQIRSCHQQPDIDRNQIVMIMTMTTMWTQNTQIENCNHNHICNHCSTSNENGALANGWIVVIPSINGLKLQLLKYDEVNKLEILPELYHAIATVSLITPFICSILFIFLIQHSITPREHQVEMWRNTIHNQGEIPFWPFLFVGLFGPTTFLCFLAFFVLFWHRISVSFFCAVFSGMIQ